jgi:hypothetical protein
MRMMKKFLIWLLSAKPAYAKGGKSGGAQQTQAQYEYEMSLAQQRLDREKAEADAAALKEEQAKTESDRQARAKSATLANPEDVPGVVGDETELTKKSYLGAAE